jgi:glycine betaine/proline transport system ATP-binding protein
MKKGMSKDEIFQETGNTIGLKEIQIDIQKNELFCIMGLSGSGKSTLIRCLNRIIDPTKGDILIDSQNITKFNSEKLRDIRRKKISMVFQNFALLPHRNVVDNVAFGLEIQGVDKEIRYKKASEVLETVGLKGYEETRIQELSGGMKQRVGLARALATDADILLMDEAFSALDPLIKSNMQDELLALQKSIQKTIIFITHDLDEALKIGDRIAIMKDGMVVQVGTPREILENPASDYVAEFIANVDKERYLNNSKEANS